MSHNPPHGTVFSDEAVATLRQRANPIRAYGETECRSALYIVKHKPARKRFYHPHTLPGFVARALGWALGFGAAIVLAQHFL